VFDVGRALAMIWASLVILRARVWDAILPIALAAYLFALAVTSGINVRHEGPQEPMAVLLLVIGGPTAIPRGRPPGLPLASLVVGSPLLADLIVIGTLLLVTWRLASRSQGLPAFSPENERLHRVVLALLMVAGVEGLSLATRAVPRLFDSGSPFLD